MKKGKPIVWWGEGNPSHTCKVFINEAGELGIGTRGRRRGQILVHPKPRVSTSGVERQENGRKNKDACHSLKILKAGASLSRGRKRWKGGPRESPQKSGREARIWTGQANLMGNAGQKREDGKRGDSVNGIWCAAQYTRKE